MSKYDPLWANVARCAQAKLKLSFEEIQQILGFPIDYSFLKYKKELLPLGYRVEKISMKEACVRFLRDD